MIRTLGLASALALASGSASAVLVQANQSGLTLIGTFGAGTYEFSATGIVSLTGGSDFLMAPTGIPAATVTAAGYGYFNPSGASFDALAGNAPGAVGTGALIGGLYATTLVAPASPSDYFLVGNGAVTSFAVPTSLYARVNDTYYDNNTGAYDVQVTAVPEPHEWAMMLAGLGVVGWIGRRRRASQPAAVAAA